MIVTSSFLAPGRHYFRGVPECARVSWRPANDATSEEVEAVFDAGGPRMGRCQAREVPGWVWCVTTQEQGGAALLERAGCGTSGPTSGFVGYLDGEPAGWAAAEPRKKYRRLWARQKSWVRRVQPRGSGLGTR